jgi:hypothetical protein
MMLLLKLFDGLFCCLAHSLVFFGKGVERFNRLRAAKLPQRFNSAQADPPGFIMNETKQWLDGLRHA